MIQTLATLSTQNTGRSQSKLKTQHRNFGNTLTVLYFFFHFILTLITAGITETND